MRPTRQQLFIAILLSTLAALALVSFLVAAFPELMFRLQTEQGEPIRSIRFASVPSVLAVVAGGVAAFGGVLAVLFNPARLQPFGALVAILSVQGFAFAGYAVWEFHESPEFCVRTCHVMEPYYLSFAEAGENAVMANHTRNETAKCLDCHTGPGVQGQVDLMAASARHVWKYAISKDYDPESLGGTDAVKTVPDKNCVKCHSPTLEEKLPPEHDRFDTKCALCHDPHRPNGTGYFFPEIILEKEDCSKCHKETPKDFDVFVSKHSEIAKDDCRECHQSHGTRENPGGNRTIKGCNDEGCHEKTGGDPQLRLSANHSKVENPTDCSNCHGTAHNLTEIPPDQLVQNCDNCHGQQSLAVGNLHASANVTKNLTRSIACTDCHGSDARRPDMAETLTTHGNLQCLECHKESNTIGAPIPAFTFQNESQISWQRRNGMNWAVWNQTGRGAHDATQDCGQCHPAHNTSQILYPPPPSTTPDGRCEASCHRWLGNITQYGFSYRYQADPINDPANASKGGQVFTTRYSGPMNPQYLLQIEKEMDGDNRTHKTIYEKWGCTGFCHNPAMTLEISEAWGVPMFRQNGGQESVEPTDLAPGTVHGFINKCTNCHRVISPWSGDEDELHNTHETLVGGEKAIDDVTAPPEQTACEYCHSRGPYPDKPAGGCYNCHFSGHLPETYYWGQG